MTAPDPYAPLPANHPAVRERLLCPCCERPFAVGDVTCLWPLAPDGSAPVWPSEQEDSGGLVEARLLHHVCAVRVAAAITVRRAWDQKRGEQVDAVAFSTGAESVSTPLQWADAFTRLAAADSLDRFAWAASMPNVPLPAHHPAVTAGEKCALCGQPFTVGQVAGHIPVGPDSDGNYHSVRAHHACAERVDRERLRAATMHDPRAAFYDSDEEDTPARELAQLREALAIYASDAMHWRDYALKLERYHPGANRPPGFAPALETARLDFLERRLREHGPDLGYLLGLSQGWTNLRAAIDQAQATSRR